MLVLYIHSGVPVAPGRVHMVMFSETHMMEV